MFCVWFFTSMPPSTWLNCPSLFSPLKSVWPSCIWLSLCQRKLFTILRITDLSARKLHDKICAPDKFLLSTLPLPNGLVTRKPQGACLFDLFLISLTGLTQEKSTVYLQLGSCCRALASLKCSQQLEASRCLLKPAAESRWSLMSE